MKKKTFKIYCVYGMENKTNWVDYKCQVLTSFLRAAKASWFTNIQTKKTMANELFTLFKKNTNNYSVLSFNI